MTAETQEKPSYRAQVIGSILVALLITVAVVALVTTRLGTGMTRERYEEREDLLEERDELREDRREERQDRLDQ